MKKRSGQILVLVLLVVVVSLAVGLSLASRNITNLRTTAQSEQSQRAFSAAEGGVEDVLAKLSAVAKDIAAGTSTNSGCTPGSGGTATCTVNYGAGNLGATIFVKASPAYEQVIDESSLGQVTLESAPGISYTGNITIDWIKTGDSIEDGSIKPSLVITIVCSTPSSFCDTGSGGFAQKRYAVHYPGTANETGFDDCGSADGGYKCRYQISIPAGSNAKFMRIRPFWVKASIKVSGDPALPVQTYDLTSTASTDLGITRRVQVTRTALPQLPAAFDYVLFSNNDIVK